MASFGQAFSEARKKGLRKFQWNGNWYGTQLASESSAPTQSHSQKGNYKQKTSKKVTDNSGRAVGGVSTDRYTIRNHGNQGYSVYDNEVGRYVGNLHKTREDASSYLKSDKFKQDAGEFTTVAARKDMNRNTSGWLPVDNSNYKDKQGNTRVFKQQETGRFVVTDNTGEIVGYSFDSNASKPGFTGWMEYTGSKNNLQAALAGMARNTANVNENNQLAEQKEIRQRLGQEGMQQWVHEGRIAGANTINQAANLPIHATVGTVRATLPGNDYNWDDYTRGFNLNQAHTDLGQTMGIGDVVADYMPEGKAKDMVQIMGNVAGNGLLFKALTNKKPYTQSQQTGWRMRSMGYGKTALPNQSGKIVPPSQMKGIITPGEFEANFTRMTPGTQSKGYLLSYNPRTRAPQARLAHSGPIKGGGVFVSNKTFQWEPVMRNHRFTRPGTFTPIQAIVQTVPENIQTQNSAPMANFDYTNGGNNRYATSRITYGEPASGTSGENWNGRSYGGRLRVTGDNRVSPSLGLDNVVGFGKDNQSNYYLPISR